MADKNQETNNTRITLRNKQPLKILWTTALLLRFNNIHLIVRFSIVKNMAVDISLGTPFIDW